MNKDSVLVIGAGLSGLRASLELHRKGKQVTIVEARDRIGGRIYTRDLKGTHIELGAEWIGSKDVLMQKLCAEFGLELINHELITHLLYEGVHMKPGEWKPDAGWEKELKRLVEQFPALTQEQVTRLQNIDWWHFLRQHHVPTRDMHILDLIRSSDFGEDMRFIPAYDVLYDYAVGGDGATATSYTLKDGNRSLADAMLKEIGYENLHMNEVVKEVMQTQNGVQMRCASGSVYDAEYVICTTPALAVSNITWTPALPDAQSDAYNQLTYARITKTAAHYPEQYWKEETFDLMTDQVPQQIYHATPGQTDNGAALMSYAVGDKAAIMSHLNDAEKAEAIAKPMRVLFGELHGECDAIASYYWGDDPYTGGAYPVFEYSERKMLQPLLQLPHGRVFFAGEHTAIRYGFMEGAVESGERAAQQVLEQMG